jgi:hypothetical protein
VVVRIKTNNATERKPFPVANHRHAIALFVAVFNFCRIHKSLDGKAPAMAAHLTDHVWTVEELLSVV